MELYDAIIIGAGQAGTPLAKRLARRNKKTLLIEKDQVGGSCINIGCTPTKTWVASAKAAFRARMARELGIEVPNIRVNMPAVWRRKEAIVEAFRGSVQKGIDATEGLDFLRGTASFTGSKTLHVKRADEDEKQYSAEWIFIDTGSTPQIPDIPGLRESGYRTASSILDLQEVPEHLLIIGGGYIGLEYGQMFRRFGSRVSILERSDTLLDREDPEVRQAMEAVLEAESIEWITQAEVEHIQGMEPALEIQVKTNGKTRQLKGTHLLIATGRRGQTDALQLHKTGLQADEQGYIPVNNHLETKVPGIFALGEVNGGPAFTHIAYNDHVLVYDYLMEGKRVDRSVRSIPYCMYTDPQLGRVGLTEHQARAQGYTVKTAVLPMREVGRAVETENIHGVMKAVVDADTGQILGVAVLGAEGGEIMAVLQMAMTGKIPYQQLQYHIFAHPSYAEAINTLFFKLS